MHLSLSWYETGTQTFPGLLKNEMDKITSSKSQTYAVMAENRDPLIPSTRHQHIEDYHVPILCQV